MLCGSADRAPVLPAAIMKMKKGPANGKQFTDEDWNDEATLTEGSYPYSKVRGAPSLSVPWRTCTTSVWSHTRSACQHHLSSQLHNVMTHMQCMPATPSQ